MAKSKARRGGGGGAPPGHSGGIFSGMRSGMKNMVGAGKKSGKKKPVSFWDVLFWIAAGLLGAAVLYRWLN